MYIRATVTTCRAHYNHAQIAFNNKAIVDYTSPAMYNQSKFIFQVIRENYNVIKLEGLPEKHYAH